MMKDLKEAITTIKRVELICQIVSFRYPVLYFITTITFTLQFGFIDRIRINPTSPIVQTKETFYPLNEC